MINLNKTILILVLFFFADTETNVLFSKSLQLFDGKFLIDSKHSYNYDNSINWSNEFILKKKKKNNYEYKLENKN